jgi:flagellar biosynthetic protein FlhB
VLVRFWVLAKFAAINVLPILLAMAAAALALNLVQVGFLLAPEVLQPQLSRINPLDGAKRLFSIRALVRLAVSLGKLAAVVAVAGISIHAMLPGFLGLMESSVAAIFQRIEESVVVLAFQLSGALVTLAILDFLFQRWKHEQDLRMTKHELREELKQMEGDPLIRQRRREAHRKLAQARELQQVRHADVVITNPTEIAVAIKYDPQTMPAPAVVAKGMGEIAARIRQIAIEYHVPIVERKPLARALYRDVRVGQTIPLEMYEVFVEIMAYVYRLTGRTPSGLK